MEKAHDVFRQYLHVQDDGRTDALPVSDSFWEELMSGKYPQLEHGRLLSAFTFGESWTSWERHPAGDEVVVLLSGAADVVLDEPDGERIVRLDAAGDYVLIPRGTWHTTRTTVPTKMLFLTPGAGTEHKPA